MLNRIALLSFLVTTSGMMAQAPATQPARHWAVTIRDPYLRGIGEDTVWSAARSVGLDRVECVLGKDLALPHLFEKDGAPYRIDTPEHCKVLRDRLAAEKMSIGCMCLVIKLGTTKDEARALDWVQRAAEAAPQVGCQVLMLPIAINNPDEDKKVGDEEFIARGKSFMQKLAPIAEKTRVQITIENLGHYWNRPEVLMPVLQACKPDQVGLLHDVANMYWFGHPLDKLYELTRLVAPHVRCVHVKSVKYPEDKRQQQRSPGWEYGKYAEPVRTGDIDFAKILAIYAKAGYVGDVCIEDDSLGKFDAAGKKKVIADDVALLKELITGLPKAP